MKKLPVVCNTVLMPASLTSMTVTIQSEIEQCSTRLLAFVWSHLVEEKETS